MSKIINTEQFINDVIKIHGDIYDYSLVNYITAKTKVKIICLKHGIFEQTPTNHKKGQGCPYCAGNYLSNTSEFIEKAIKIHSNKYDYSLVEYVNNNTKIKIICYKHGVFETTPQSHLTTTHGCVECYREYQRKTQEQFIIDAIKIHGDKYDYSLVNYINNITKIKIICSKHGIFEQLPNTHLNNKGCPKCYDNVSIINKNLYILYDNLYDIYKIGYSKNVQKRKKRIEQELKYEIEIVNIYENMATYENNIHKMYENNRIQYITVVIKSGSNYLKPI